MDTYIIQLCGQIDVEELNRFSPHQMTGISAGEEVTTVSIQTDQSGLIGLLSYIHNLGIILKSVESRREDVRRMKERND